MADKNDLLFDKPTLVDGGQSQDAVVVTSPEKQHVNAPTVDDIQRIAKGIAEKEAEAASATEWEKSVKEHLYEEDGYVVAESTYGLRIIITDIAEGFTIGTDTDYDALCFDFSFLELGLSDRSDMYIDVNNQEISCTNVRCENIVDIETDGSVAASNLVDGSRLFRHAITLNKSGSNIAFIFSFYLSSATDIDNIGDYLESNSVDGISGIVKDIANNLSYIGVILSDESDIVVVYNGTTVSFNDSNTVVTDDVIQC